MQLCLIRHARVTWDRGLCLGRSDAPADAQATADAAQALLAHTPLDGWPLWHSPLSRCQDLAQALQRGCPALRPMGADARLAEMDFGEWEGRPWDSLGPGDFAPWMADFAHHPVGGGDSVAGFMQRVARALADTRAHCQAHGHTRALWVAHAGVARALSLWHSGQGIPAQASGWPTGAPEPGQWVVFDWPDTPPV